jgi:enoyl-CoA hydratase/carnithine racemase
MVRAVVSRVIPRSRISKAAAKETQDEAARRALLALGADAPASVNSIPTQAAASREQLNSAGAAIRPIGCSRRVFLLDPHLTATELDGLAHRIHALSKNVGINSILIATDDRDDQAHNCLPTFASEELNSNFDRLDIDFDPVQDNTWHVSGGYNPVALFSAQNGMDDANDKYVYMMDSVRNLALSTKGSVKTSHIPVITMPHGMVTDSGYALCLGSYVLATPQSYFQILNPSRGLALDPIGFSFFLPRLGWEYNQRSSNFKGCGMILALTGYEANSHDMVETGLATHTVSSVRSLALLERHLAAIPPFDQQGLVKKPQQTYGRPTARDANSRFRNVTVAYTVEQIAEYSANKANELQFDYTQINAEDPALDVEIVPWESAFFASGLVDVAATFDKIFTQEETLEGLVERFREIGSREATDPEVQEGIDVAKGFVSSIERQSPLALRVVHKLMTLGGGRKATIEACMERERTAQLKLFQKPDFQNWAEHVLKYGGNEAQAPSFTGWKHKNVAAVSEDEVDEILG